jgi:hypothetical protein
MCKHVSEVAKKNTVTYNPLKDTTRPLPFLLAGRHVRFCEKQVDFY